MSPPPPPSSLSYRYTPEMNPIEMAWQYTKDQLYRHLVALRADPHAELTRLLHSISPQFCENWVRLAGCYNI
jgi:transposase